MSDLAPIIAATTNAALIRFEMLMKVLGVPLDDPRCRYFYANLLETYTLVFNISESEAKQRVAKMFSELQTQRAQALKHGGNHIVAYGTLISQYSSGLIKPYEINVHLNRLRGQIK